MRVCSSLELCFWSVAEVFVPLSCAGCAEHCGALLFTLHSSLIIHRHPLSLGSLLSTLHTIFLFSLCCSPHTPSLSFLVIPFFCYLSALSPLKSSPPPLLLCGALSDNEGIPRLGRRKRGEQLELDCDWQPCVGLAVWPLSLCQGKWREPREVEQWEGGGKKDQLGHHSCVEVLAKASPPPSPAE